MTLTDKLIASHVQLSDASRLSALPVYSMEAMNAIVAKAGVEQWPGGAFS